MTPSTRCIDFIKSFEGYSETAYDDGVGVITIGYGTIRYPDGSKVMPGDTCTKEQAEEWLLFEINKKAEGVSGSLKETPVNQNQFDALVSFAYNMGNNALHNSTLLKKLHQNPHDATIYQYTTNANGEPVIDSCEFLRWVRGGGQVMKGLVRRRAAEADMYAGKG